MIILGWVCVSLGLLVKRHLSNTLISLTGAKTFLKKMHGLCYSLLASVMMQVQGLCLTGVLHSVPVLTSKDLGQHKRILNSSVSLSEKPNQTGLLTFYFSSTMLFEIHTDHRPLTMVLGLLLHSQA